MPISEALNRQLYEKFGDLVTEDELDALCTLAEAVVRECSQFAKQATVPPGAHNLQLAAIVASDLQIEIPAEAVRDRRAMGRFLAPYLNDDLLDRQNCARTPLPCTAPQRRLIARALRRVGVRCNELPAPMTS